MFKFACIRIFESFFLFVSLNRKKSNLLEIEISTVMSKFYLHSFVVGAAYENCLAGNECNNVIMRHYENA